MEYKSIVFTPFRKGHTHFYDYIESFPGLPDAEPFDQQGLRIRNEIKRQMITGKEEDAKLCNKISESRLENPWLLHLRREAIHVVLFERANWSDGPIGCQEAWSLQIVIRTK